MKTYRLLFGLLCGVSLLAGYWLTRSVDRSPSPKTDRQDVSAAGGYSGSADCKGCHERFYGLWVGSRHGLAMQPYTEEFSRMHLTPPADSIAIGEEGARYLAEVAPGQGRIREIVSGREKTYPIAHVLGGKNVYYFLTILDRGRLQRLPLAYDVRKKAWYDAGSTGGGHLHDGVGTRPIPWTDRLNTFNTSCYGCHVSQITTRYDLETDSYGTQWTEPGINCEACHGPGREHAKAFRSARKDAPPRDRKIVSTKSFSADQTNSLCGSCHARMSPISTSFLPGERYFDHFDLVALESPDFHPDGRDLGENYTMTLWRMSPCVKAGNLTCLHCHTSSGRYLFEERADANSACLPCHRDQAANISVHSGHRLTDRSPRCIDCHMPMTTFANMNRTDHSMRPPVPQATLKYRSPNACNICHADKGAVWAQRQVVRWNMATRQARYLRLASFVDQARRRDWRNLDQILAYVRTKDRDEIIAGSLVRLLRGCDAAAKWPVLIGVLEKDSSPLVRAAAAEGLGGHLNDETLRVLLKAVKDDYRLVRVRAAASLAGIDARRPGDAAAGEPLAADARRDFEQAMEELIQGMSARPDHPATHYNLGNLHMEQGRVDEALAAYRKALGLDPDFVPAYINMAFAYNASGRNADAEQCFLEALKREPDNGLVLTNLGLLYGETGQVDKAESAFRRASILDPKSAVAAYNLAVLLAAKAPMESLSLFEKAASLSPDEPRYAYAYAFHLSRLDRTGRAVAVLRGQVARNTSNGDVYTLLGQLLENSGDIKGAVEVYTKASASPNLPESLRRAFLADAERARKQVASR